MKSLFTTLALSLAAFAVIAFNAATAKAADDREISSADQPVKVSKSQQIRDYAQNCFDQEMDLFEHARGRLPTDDEADLIIDACANPKLK
jgi:hypothetical protein